MTNNTLQPSRLNRLADRMGEYAWQASVFALFMYVIGLIDRDGRGIGWALVFWSGLYLFFAPFIVRRVASRTPPGDRWRAAAVLAYGAFPFSVLIPWWTELTAWPAAIATFPALFAWGLAAQIVALHDKGPVRPPRVRALVLAGAGAICGLTALLLFGCAGIGLLIGVWDPPAGAALTSPLVMLLCLPLAFAAGYASLKLFGAAAQAYAGAALSRDGL